VSDLEGEGRCVITDHQAFVLLNTYCPALASADRMEYKLQFHALLEDRVQALREANKRVVVVVRPV
jgi:AP endonuclease-2